MSRALRCPQCKIGLALSADAVVLSSAPLSAGQASICPICQTSIEAGASCVTCPGCDQVHHQECWAEIGGCGTYGCAQSPSPQNTDEAAPAARSAWGDTKKCPACAEVIKSIALRCRYCGTDFTSVDPMSVSDLRKQAVIGEQVETMKKITVGLFVVSLLGFLAPISLLVSLAYVLPRREMISKAGPVFVIMGWTAIVLSGLYSLLMLGFFLAG